MGLLPKETADRLFREGKMPEWWYRQKYKTFQENWVDSLSQSQRKSRDYFEQKKNKKQEQHHLEQKINHEIERALKKAFSRFPLK